VGDFDPRIGALVGTMVVSAVVVMAALLWMFGPWACDARWPDMETRWELGAGCLVGTPDGFVPQQNVLVVP
jgi:hypothetical protein